MNPKPTEAQLHSANVSLTGEYRVPKHGDHIFQQIEENNPFYDGVTYKYQRPMNLSYLGPRWICKPAKQRKTTKKFSR